MSEPMHTKQIVWMGRAAVLACDGNCAKAWGISRRAKVVLGPDEDDVAWPADNELGDAPADPGTYEGEHGKPDGPHEMNKWCARECERSDLAGSVEAIKLPDWTRRIVNQPWKHQTAQQGVR